MDAFDGKFRIGILACLSGFAAGLATCSLINVAGKRRSDKAVTPSRRFGELVFSDCDRIGTKTVARFNEFAELASSGSGSQVIIIITISLYLWDCMLGSVEDY